MKRTIALLAVVAAALLLTPAALVGLLFVRDAGKRRWLTRAALIGLVPYLLAFYARFVEPKTLAVRQAEIVSPLWRDGSIRIGVISDTHVGGPHVSALRMEKIVARMNALRPDVVVLLGDYAHGRLPSAERTKEDRAEVEKGIAALSRLAAPKGVYAAIGNNDLLYGVEEIRAALVKAHVTVLENGAAAIPGANAYVVGVDEFRSGRGNGPAAVAKAPPGTSLIAIMHYPDSFVGLPPVVALSVAGHSHCGQIGVPLATKFVNASPASGRWRCHLYKSGDSQIYVSGGIGTSVLPMRFLAPPEIAILTLSGE
jgi:uncharacterized protein